MASNAFTILAKYQPPQLPRVLPRERLLKRLQSNRDKNLWLLIGQAAQGKSTLMATWAQTCGQPTAWLNLGPEDAPVENLLLSLAGALAQAVQLDAGPLLAHSGLGRRPLADPSQWPRLAGLILQAAGPGTQLVLDGLDRLPADAPSLGLVEALARAVPLDRRLVVLSRHLAPLDAPGAVLGRQALVLDNQALACTPAESASFLKRLGGHRLGRRECMVIHRLTEGWTGGVVLCGEALHAIPDDERQRLLDTGFPHHLKGDLFRFFEESAWAAQSPETRAVLLATAPFPAVSVRLAQGLSGVERAGDLLAELARRHLFITQTLDPRRGRVFRCHQLLREFLWQRHQETWGQEGRRRLMTRAGELWEDQDCLEEALDCHLRADQKPRAARLIRRLAPQALQAGRSADVNRWLEALPQAMVQADPWLIYFQCQARRWITPQLNIPALASALAEFRNRDDRRGALLALSTMLHSLFASSAPWSRVARCCQEAVEFMAAHPPDGDFRERAALLSQIAFVQAIRGEPRLARAACQEGYALARQVDDPALTVELLIYWMDAFSLGGDLDQAARKEKDLLEALTRCPSPELEIMSLYPRSYLRLLRGDVEEAMALAVRFREQITAQGFVQILAVGLLYEHLACAAAGNLERSRELMDQVSSLPPVMCPPFILAGSRVLLAISLYKNGQYAQAAREGAEASRVLASDQALCGAQWAYGLFTQVLAGRRLGHDVADLACMALNVWEQMRDTGYRQLRVEAELALALLAADLGKDERVEHWLEAATQESLRHDYHYFMLLSDRDLADLLAVAVERGREASAALLLRMAQRKAVGPARARLDALGQDPSPRTRALAGSLSRRQRLENAPPLVIQTLGVFQVTRGDHALSARDWGRRQARLLLMALLVLGPEGVPKERLVECLWPEAQPQASERNFRVTLHRLRKALEPNLDPLAGSCYVSGEDSRLSLNLELCQVDLARLRQLLAEGRRHRRAGHDREALGCWTRAEELYQGEFLASEPYLEWAQPTRQALREDFLDMLAAQGRLLRETHQADQAAAAWRRLLRHDPCRESAYRELMLIQAGQGDRAKVRQTYQECRQTLARELDAQPAAETERVYRDLLAGRRQ